MLNRVEHNVDFCVVGGGLAGMCAAIQAARKGKSVVLVQERPVLGGNASSEVRMWVCGAAGQNNRETGIIEEINLESLYRNPYKNYSVWDSILYGKVHDEPNITLLLNTSVCDVDMEGGRIKTAVAWQMTTQSWHYIQAKFYADCSGDSILAPLTHAEFRLGRESSEEFDEYISVKEQDNKTMGLSCLIQARKMDEDVEFIAPSWAKKLTDEEFSRRLPRMESNYENFWFLELGGNRDTIGDTESIRDELLALAFGYWDYFKNSGKFDASKWQLEFLGFLPAKRESRRMVGPHILTQREVLDGGHFEDVVAYGGWPLDDHDPDGFYSTGSGTTNTDPNSFLKGVYGIPYRCLYSANIENLFFAGRNISATHAAISSSRVMMTCAVLGQAVGEAVSVAVEYDTTPQGVYDFYMEELQQNLLRSDCFIPYFTRNVGKPTRNADLSGCESVENLRNGIDRNNVLYGDTETGVFTEIDSKITYKFAEPQYVEIAHLVFDSDLDRNTIPGDECEKYHSMRCNIFPDSPKMHLPTTLMKDYSLLLVLADGTEKSIDVTDNIQRMNEVVIDSLVKEIAFIPKKLWSDDKTVHLFSFDLY